jgi:CheY-like chemotaxis protein
MPDETPGMSAPDEMQSSAHDRVMQRLSRRASLPGGNERILIVDDEPLVQRVNAAELRRLGYAISCASNGEEALTLLQAEPADLVLLDMVMPGIDGVETFRRIKKTRPEQKVVVYSGFAEPEKVREIEGLGAHRILSKPCPIEDLAKALREVLDGDAPAG